MSALLTFPKLSTFSIFRAVLDCSTLQLCHTDRAGLTGFRLKLLRNACNQKSLSLLTTNTVLNSRPKSKMLERERGRRQQIKVIAPFLTTKSSLTAGIPLLTLQGHPMTHPCQVLFQQDYPKARENVPFQINSSALLLCFKPQELNSK